MEITYYGANSMQIATKGLKVAVDPVTGEYGPDPKLKADVVLYSQLPLAEHQPKADFVIDRPGEYEIKGMTIEGISARLHTEEDADRRAGIMYVLSHHDVRVLICGNIHPDLNDEQIERADGVDILMVPVGGHGLTLDKEAASELVRQFDPSFVVPVHYDDGKTNYPVPQDAVDAFLHEVGASDAQKEDSLKVTRRDTSEETTFIVLKPQTAKKK